MTFLGEDDDADIRLFLSRNNVTLTITQVIGGRTTTTTQTFNAAQLRNTLEINVPDANPDQPRDPALRVSLVFSHPDLQTARLEGLMNIDQRLAIVMPRNATCPQDQPCSYWPACCNGYPCSVPCKSGWFRRR
jgi:hypothetical protein